MFMKIVYEYESSSNTLTVKPTGAISINDIFQYFNNVINDDSVKKIDIEFVLFDQVKDFAFSYSETHSLREQYRDMRKRKGYGLTVFVAKDGYHFGMARMLSSVLGDEFKQEVVNDSLLAKDLIEKWRLKNKE